MGNVYFDPQTWHRMKQLKMDIEMNWTSDWNQTSWFSHTTLMHDYDLKVGALNADITIDWQIELADILVDRQVETVPPWETRDSPGDAWVQMWKPRWRGDGAA